MGRAVIHISVAVRDLEEALAWYGSTFGAQVGRKTPRWADVDFFGAQLTLQNDPEGLLPRDKQMARHFGATLEWDRWTELAADLQRRGARFEREPAITLTETDREQAKLYLEDPSGNIIELKAYRHPEKVLGGIWR